MWVTGVQTCALPISGSLLWWIPVTMGAGCWGAFGVNVGIRSLLWWCCGFFPCWHLAPLWRPYPGVLRLIAQLSTPVGMVCPPLLVTSWSTPFVALLRTELSGVLQSAQHQSSSPRVVFLDSHQVGVNASATDPPLCSCFYSLTQVVSV